MFLIIERDEPQELTTCFHRQQIQHYTNQLAKETNKHLKELGSIPLPISPSEQVGVDSIHQDLTHHYWDEQLWR